MKLPCRPPGPLEPSARTYALRFPRNRRPREEKRITVISCWVSQGRNEEVVLADFLFLFFLHGVTCVMVPVSSFREEVQNKTTQFE